MFRCQHKVVAPSGLGDPLTDDLFSAANSFRLDRVNRIHLGGVDKVDPRIKGAFNLRMAFLGGVLRPPSH